MVRFFSTWNLKRLKRPQADGLNQHLLKKLLSGHTQTDSTLEDKSVTFSRSGWKERLQVTWRRDALIRLVVFRCLNEIRQPMNRCG